MVKWDEFAALVALVAIPIMLSPSAIQLIKAIVTKLYTILYPTTARCARLQWSDVPEGRLINCEDCGSEQDDGLQIHRPTSSLTLEFVFERAWVSPSRRDVTVKKPKQLDLNRRYVRMDTKTIQAYILLLETPEAVDLRIVDGVLTAHLTSERGGIPDLCGLTKKAVDLILQGYPPFYRESLQVLEESSTSSQRSLRSPNHVTPIPSPIQSQSDIYRGGWILAVGLFNYPFQSCGIAHKMEEIKYQDLHGYLIGDLVPRQKAVQRVRHVLEMIQEAFPEQEETIVGALEFINVFFPNGKNPSVIHRSQDLPPSELAIGLPRPYDFPKSARRSYIHKSKLFSVDADFYDLRPGRGLSAESCTRVMNIFNRFDPLTSDEVNFLRPILLPVLRAAGRGIFVVMTDKDLRRTRTPDIPELSRDRHIYAYQCKEDENHHCNCEID